MPGLLHVDEQDRETLVRRRLGIGAHQQLAPVGEGTERGPHLLPVDDEVVAVAHGARAHGGEVAAGVGLGEALTPDVVAAQHARQEALLLRVAAEVQDRGSDVREADRVQRARRVGALHLLGEHDLFDHARSRARRTRAARRLRRAARRRACDSSARSRSTSSGVSSSRSEKPASDGSAFASSHARTSPRKSFGLGRIAKLHAAASGTTAARAAAISLLARRRAQLRRHVFAGALADVGEEQLGQAEERALEAGAQAATAIERELATRRFRSARARRRD